MLWISPFAGYKPTLLSVIIHFMKNILNLKIRCLISVVLIGLFLFAGLSVLIAEELDGRLFLGEELTINLAEKESFFQELLRYLNLRNEPRNLVNLSELGMNGDNLFIGEDMKLYYSSETRKGSAYCIGDARKLWNLALDKDVDLLQVKVLADLFSENKGAGYKLRVKTDSSKPKAKEIKQATFQFWLEELVFEYDSYSPEKSTDENYPYICNAIKSALPYSPDAPKNRLSKLIYLVNYVKITDGSDLIPLRDLITQVIDTLKTKTVPASFAEQYKKLKADIFKKTEGL